MKRFLLILFATVNFNLAAQTALNEIALAMQNQQEAWNKGNIEAFMNYYWKSDSLKFIGKSGINYGWQKTLDNYLKSYPDRATMGQLTFTNISVEPLSETSCYVIGKWELKRPEKGDVGGYYTLLWKKIDGKWLIVVDHTS